ncbi:Hypothetical protein FKW44_011508, partial [Caligus rogercresseyi]
PHPTSLTSTALFYELPVNFQLLATLRLDALLATNNTHKALEGTLNCRLPRIQKCRDLYFTSSFPQ